MPLLPDRRERALRRARRRSRPVLHLLHVRKSGGTAVKDALANAPVARAELVLHPHRVTLADLPPGEQVAFVLRDPLTRYVSGFYSRLRQGLPRHHFPWTEQERAAFSVYGSADRLAVALGSPDDDERRRAEVAMQQIRHVRDTYATWFGSPEQFLARRDDVVFIGRQESLAADFERLKALLGLPPSVHLPPAGTASHGTPAGFDTTLSPGARDNLRRWYAADYEFLELCARHADELGYRPH